MNQLTVKGVPYFWMEMTAVDRGKKDICGLSKRIIQPGEQVTAVCNNFKTFPNKVVLTEELEKVGIEETICYLANQYASYLEAKKQIEEKYAEWL